LPDPGHLAVLARPVVVRAASALLRIPGVELPSASPARCDGPAAVSFHHRSVQERLVALDVGQPQLVGRGAGEATIHQIHGEDVGRARTPLGRPVTPLISARAISSSTVPWPDGQAAAEGRLGVHPPEAIGATGEGVHLADGLGEQRVADAAGRGRAASTRRNPTPTRPGRGRPSAPTVLRWPSPRWPRTAFWGHHLPQQLRGPPMHRQLGLQGGDPPPGDLQFGLLCGGQSRLEPLVDAVLPAPGVDRLITDAQRLATSATGRPDSTRSSTLRRNSAGYPRRPMRPSLGLGRPQNPVTRLRETGGTPVHLASGQPRPYDERAYWRQLARGAPTTPTTRAAHTAAPTAAQRQRRRAWL
jgi:hypothetical protein